MAKKQKDPNLIKLQLEFEPKLYGKVIETATTDNSRMNLVKRDEKIHTYQMIHVLIQDGLNYRNHEIYAPDDMKKSFAKDEKYQRLLAKAQVALEEFKEYQNKLL